MGNQERHAFTHTWEQAVETLRRDPAQHDLIFYSYLTADLGENGNRFFVSGEFAAVLALLKQFAPRAKTVLDIPGGNGIAAHAFAKAGFAVTTVEPNPSDTVGRGAIAVMLAASGLVAKIVDAYGEDLPFADSGFDVVYVRQGLHHAANLPGMVRECARVLKPGGVMLACREHVVDDYGASLAAFLATQVDHQLYGGEHAYTLADYRAALDGAGLIRTKELKPFDSVINLYPSSPGSLRAVILASRPGRLLSQVLPESWVVRLGLWRMRRRKSPGRLYSFLAVKPGGTI